MTIYSYLPLAEPYDHFDYPDDFEYGAAEGDDAVFGSAWAAMLSDGAVAVRFEVDTDPDTLEEAGAILVRGELPDLARVAFLNAASAMAVLTLLSEREAIFADSRHAQVAAMMFGGAVLS